MTAQAEGNDACLLCSLEDGEVAPLGDWVYQTAGWSVAVIEKYAVPGWFTVHLRRHVATLSGLNESEAADLGRVLARLCKAVEAVTGASRVYAVWFGENMRHLHFQVAARTSIMEDGPKGPELLAARDQYMNEDEALRVAELVRSRLADEES